MIKYILKSNKNNRENFKEIYELNFNYVYSMMCVVSLYKFELWK